ncbi:MAG: 4Fe-4S dicluster domain-containing protein [Candidatus Hydrogenedentes bacterium]|nr:4Fe-4S dicluster domain-containing protein [Candidatus Hydrogenedentota bacterium]
MKRPNPLQPSSLANPTSRRAFLENTAFAVTGAMATVAGGASLCQVFAEGTAASAPAAAPAGVYDPTKHRYVFLVDVNKCIGCGECVRACEVENEVPEHFFRTWIERYEVTRTGDVSIDSPNGGRDGFSESVTGGDVTKAFFVPKLCNHCTHTPCVQLCPVGASYRSPDGVILVDEERCIGCGYCVQACPYGSRFIHPTKHVASKCTLCYHRITKGMRTACVDACPVNARMLGDAMDPNDEVSNIIATQPVAELKPELLTEPNCHYLGYSKEIR